MPMDRDVEQRHTSPRAAGVYEGAEPPVLMRHNGTNQAQNCVEFRESGVDKGVGEDVVALRDTYDTVGANLTLTDAGKHANKTHGCSDSEAESAGDGAGGVFTKHQEESHEAVDTLCCRECGEHHVASGAFRFAFEGTFGGIAGNCCTVRRTNSCKCKHQAQSKIT